MGSARSGGGPGLGDELVAAVQGDGAGDEHQHRGEEDEHGRLATRAEVADHHHGDDRLVGIGGGRGRRLAGDGLARHDLLDADHDPVGRVAEGPGDDALGLEHGPLDGAGRRVERLLAAPGPGVEDDELKDAVDGLLKARQRNRGEDGALVAALRDNLYLGRRFDFAAGIDAQYGALTPAQVHDAFKRHFGVRALSVFKAGDFEKVKKAEKP